MYHPHDVASVSSDVGRLAPKSISPSLLAPKVKSFSPQSEVDVRVRFIWILTILIISSHLALGPPVANLDRWISVFYLAK